MRLWYPVEDSGHGRGWRARGAFTLTEVSIASTIFMLVVAGVITSNIFGLRMMELTEPKQQAAQRARELINQLSEDISTAWLVEVGTGAALNTFVRVPRGSPKVGNALKIFPDGSDTNYYVVYYKDPGTDEFLRDSIAGSGPELVAWGVTNDDVFTGEFLNRDLNAWVPLEANRAAMVIRVLLQFAELERTRTPVGPDFTYKSYQFQSRLTWRAR
jgi:hypothetical protein